MGEIMVVPFTMEGFVNNLEELAQDFDKWKSPEYSAFMMAASYIRELIKYQALGTPSELAELVKARDEGRNCPHRQPVEGGIPYCEKKQTACDNCKSGKGERRCGDVDR